MVNCCIRSCVCSPGSIKVQSRVDVLLELLEVEMRDEGGLVTSRSALRYLMTTIGRALSPEKDSASPVSSSESRLCASVNSLRIIDPSMPSTGLIISRCVTAVRHNASPDILSPRQSTTRTTCPRREYPEGRSKCHPVCNYSSVSDSILPKDLRF